MGSIEIELRVADLRFGLVQRRLGRSLLRSPLRTSEMTASMDSASPSMVGVSIDMDSMCA
jgi:hypothetical protein